MNTHITQQFTSTYICTYIHTKDRHPLTQFTHIYKQTHTNTHT